MNTNSTNPENNEIFFCIDDLLSKIWIKADKINLQEATEYLSNMSLDLIETIIQIVNFIEKYTYFFTEGRDIKINVR